MKIEVTNANGRYVEAGLKDKAIEISDALFEKIINSAQSISEQITKKFENNVQLPNTIEIKYGINVDMDANILISKGSLGSNFEITLTWERDKRNA